MQEFEKKPLPGKGRDELKSEFSRKMNELGVEVGHQPRLMDYFTDAMFNAWLRGKETGWKKAWNWKRKQATQPAGV